MLINQIVKPEIQLYQKHSKAEPNEPGKSKGPSKVIPKAGNNGTIHFETARIAARIVAKYQVRNSTAKEMADMSTELFSAGIITLDEHQAMAYQREFHFDYFNFSEKYPDIELESLPKRDFVKIWEETRISETTNKNYKKAATAFRIVNILENLHCIEENYN